MTTTTRKTAPEVVARIAELHDEGLSPSDIAEILGVEGVTTPNGRAAWRRQAVANLLRSRGYTPHRYMRTVDTDTKAARAEEERQLRAAERERRQAERAAAKAAQRKAKAAERQQREAEEEAAIAERLAQSIQRVRSLSPEARAQQAARAEREIRAAWENATNNPYEYNDEEEAG
ncbi:recombinase family protein [Rhodococcus sp. NPDC058521]|uniref:recombinase family protein n=1 Tax=Rhodococcus sp. NPDC058521 TaxID=3346536 RepID=UPI0036666632